MEDDAFLLEIQRIAFELEDMVDKYGVRDQFVSVFVGGLLVSNGTDSTQLKAIYSYNITDREELEDIQDFIQHTYQEDDINLDDLLGGTGIELED